MAGIAAILRLDGGPPEGIGAMLDRLAARGPEGAEVLTDGPCALGHTHLTTTPEAVGERQPLRHADTGVMLTGEVRLDNRDDLLTALDAPRETSDARLALLAWLRWGAGMAAHLHGDFAFALWDPRHQRLHLARDRMGVRQCLYHHAPGRVFACATLPTAVLAAPGVPCRLNEVRIGDFVQGLETHGESGTFWQDVLRLPPGHHLTVDARGLSLVRYFTLEAPAPLRLRRDEDYAEAFEEIFTRAVAARLRAPDGRVGTMLSGGVDSGAIAVTGATLRRPLPTVSALGSDPGSCLETRLARASQSLPGLAPVTVRHDDLGGLKEALARMTVASEEPFDWEATLLRACYVAGRRAGLSVLLDGAAGDMVMGGPEVVAELVAAGRIRAAWAEARALAAEDGGTATGRMLAGLRHRLAPDGLRLRRALRAARAVPYAEAGFAARIGLDDRAREAARRAFRPKSPGGNAFVHWFRSGQLTAARERYDRLAGDAGMEARDPFCDLEVIRFGLSLPPEQRWRRGRPKHLLRAAMAGRLPGAVLENTDRAHLGPAFLHAALDLPPLPDRPDRITLAPSVVEYLVSPGPSNGQIIDKELTDDLQPIGSGLAAWLEFQRASGRVQAVTPGGGG